MDSTPYRDDPLPSYLENTKSTAYKWHQDMTDSTAHPSVGDNTTRENEITKEDETVRKDRIKALSSILDDLDASTKLSRTRTDEFLNTTSRSRSTSPPVSPRRGPATTQSRTNRRDLSEIAEDSEDEEELYSDLDEMINKIPSDEDPDPTMSPAPIQSTPLVRETSRSRVARDMFTTDETSPVRGLKSAQKTPAAKTPAKTVDFKSPTAPTPRYPSKPPKTPAYVAPSPIERRPSSPRKPSTQSNPPQPVDPPLVQPSDPTDPLLKTLTAQLSTMQEDLKKRDAMIQDLYKHLSAPNNREDAIARELADTKAKLEKLQGQVEVLSTPERPKPTVGGTVKTREKVGKWQEFLETPVSLSQRRSRRDTPRTSRVLDEEEIPGKGPRSPVVLPAQQHKSADDDDSDDEITRLKDALAKAEGQIAQLKAGKAAGKGPGEGHEMHSKPLAPSMMPDAKNAKLAREEKMYYRLGLYKIDRLCSNETANLLKNVLIQLDTPLDQLIYEVTHLSQKMNEYKRLQEFAEGVHERIYGGEKMELLGDEGVDVECLREMLTKVGKLARRK